MAIKLGGDTNIILTNTSFSVNSSNKITVPLFTATSNGTYYFEGDLQDSGVMSTSLNINSTPKEIWTYYDTVSHHSSYEFTLVTGDVVELETTGHGAGSNLTVTKYADEIKEIYVGEGTTDYSAMQGPCPSGFHVPGQPEFDSLYNTFISLGLSASNFANYMKIPLAGYMQSDTSISDSGTSARMATCTPREDNDTRLLYVYITSGSVGTNYNLYKGYYAYSIRPFKDEPVIPDSNWTTIYSGSGGAGVFWNQTNGLISISSDGTSWKTISDKNLGATTVYNSGDTLSESNAGKYYQRGNNYGFPGIGSSTPISTSSTKVDTTGYGPGNYYSSSTYITSGQDWSDPANNDLRGRVTGTTRLGNVRKVYVGTTKVRGTSAEFTDWDSDLVDYVARVFNNTTDTADAIGYMFGSDFVATIQYDLGISLADWAYDAIDIGTGNVRYGLQISDGGDMTDMHLQSETSGRHSSICIVRDNDDLSDAEYIVGTYDGNDGFDYQLSSLASHFSGKDTVCMFIFLE